MQNQPAQPYNPIPAMPEPTPTTVRRHRRSLSGAPSDSLVGYDSMPIEVQSITIPATIGIDDQPSAQVRAYRGGQIALATAIITGSFVTSRILGIVRTTLFAGVFGPHIPAEAFNIAFLLPNTVYNIVAGGALSSAFIPIFSDYLIERRDAKTAWHITSAALNTSVLGLTLLATLAALFTPQLSHLYASSLYSGPHANPAEAGLVVQLTRIMLLQPIILGISVLTTSVLQARQRFLLPAIGSVLYNVGLIGGILATVVDNKYGLFGGKLGILGPTWGVIVAAFLQLIIQIPGLIRGKMQYSLTFDIFHPGVRTMYKLMGPRVVNSVALYASTFAVLSIITSANNYTEGGFFGYQQAFQLILLPIGVFGMAVGQAAFPTLATLVVSKDWTRMRSIVLSTVRTILFLSVPASLGMMVLAEPITRLIFVHGVFTIEQAPLVYMPLIYFAIGIPGLALIEILVRAYYALQDSRTAVEVGIVELFFMIGLAIILAQYMGVSGVALATSIGSTGEALVLFLLLRPRLGWFKIRDIFAFFVAVLAASVVATLAALLVYTLTVYVSPHFDSPTLNYVVLSGQLILAAIVGGGVYFLCARFLRIDNTLPLDRVFGRIFRRFRRK
ncbi:MAG: murein biosynthesis integral membrane protein MurJ [Ktedonobacterales bacterium]|nr:murein biosynthesis integral membrane protein MurJ [Ktedonobacterales bacterium]